MCESEFKEEYKTVIEVVVYKEEPTWTCARCQEDSAVAATKCERCGSSRLFHGDDIKEECIPEAHSQVQPSGSALSTSSRDALDYAIKNEPVEPLEETTLQQSLAATNRTASRKTLTGDQFSTLRGPASRDLHQKVDIGTRRYSCQNCTADFPCFDSLKAHLMTHVKDPVKMKKVERPFTCNQCGAKYAKLLFFKRHQRIHTDERPYHCDDCSAKFISHGELEAHTWTHSDTRPYCCSECPAKFKSSRDLKVHKKTHEKKVIDKKKRSYLCSECSAELRDARSLRQHKWCHTGERPHICNTCSATFAHQFALRVHERIHTGERPYPCTECSAKFRASSHLTAHRRKHTGELPYSCSECSRKFRSSGERKVHERNHTGEQPYHCSECSAKFKTLAQYKYHQRTHTGK